ncbi:hypothetical protein ABBQ38_010031 [Trebouxia sp. C0009 RCD-2024]
MMDAKKPEHLAPHGGLVQFDVEALAQLIQKALASVGMSEEQAAQGYVDLLAAGD